MTTGKKPLTAAGLRTRRKKVVTVQSSKTKNENNEKKDQKPKPEKKGTKDQKQTKPTKEQSKDNTAQKPSTTKQQEKKNQDKKEVKPVTNKIKDNNEKQQNNTVQKQTSEKKEIKDKQSFPTKVRKDQKQNKKEKQEKADHNQKKVKQENKEKSKKTKTANTKKTKGKGKNQKENNGRRGNRKQKGSKFLEDLEKKRLWFEDLLFKFCRKHYIITALTGAFILFLLGLKVAVTLDDDRHPSKHPNITDHVTFSFKIKNGPSGDLVFGLYGDDCPKTVKNFIMLANHDNGYGYEDSRIFGIIPQRMILGGDIVNNDGSSGKSALEEPFEDENLKLRHKIRGTIGMMNLKNNEDSKHSSQFYITLGDCSNFDGQTVMFGHVIEGLGYLSTLERVPTDQEMHPKLRVTITSTKHKVVKT